jgi:hypothetical protein
LVLPEAVGWPDSGVGKDVESGWQAYFLLRNRIVTALLHDGRPGLLVAESMAVSLRHLVQREPAAAALRWAALKDVLHGPGLLHRDLRTAVDRATDTARREIVAPHPVSALAGSVAASARLWRRWSDLGAQYRAAVPEATSTRRWVQTFTAAAMLERRRPIWSIVVTSFHSLDMLTRTPADAGLTMRILIYRRLIETRAVDSADLVSFVVVEQVAHLLGRSPDEVDPEYGDGH